MASHARGLRTSVHRRRQRSISFAVKAVPLSVEPLERRTLLSVSLIGLPNWGELGSKPMTSAGSISDPNNPASGAVEDIAVDPNNPAHVLISSVNGGVWRSTNANRPFNLIDDDGVNGVDDALEQPDWFPLTDNFPSLAMQHIAFDPSDPSGNTIFAGTGSSSSLGNSGGVPIGMFKTTDGGNTWSVTALNPGNEPQVRAVVPTALDADPVAPGVQQVVLVGTTAGARNMYRSTDGGQTYTQLTLATNGLPNGPITSIVSDPNNASRFFAGVVGQGVFRSDDGGANWNAFNTNLTNIAGSTTLQLSAHPGGGTTQLHVLISGPAPVAFTSTDGGTNWNPLAAIPAAFTSTNNGLYTTWASDQLTVDPTNAQIVYISKGYGGGQFIFRYNPAGAGSWVRIEGTGAAGGTQPHVDNRDLEFIGNNVLVSANDGGIYFIRDPQNAIGNRWTSLHGRGANGLGVTEYTNIAWDSTFDVATGGAQDNGTTVQNGAGDVVWTLYHGADGGDVAVDTVNAGAGRVFRYASSQNFGATFMTPFAGGLTRHTFDSATNQPAGTATDLITTAGLTGFNPTFVPAFELNAISLTRMIVGGGGTSPVYELTNAATTPNAASATWQAVPIGAGFGAVSGSFAVGGRLNGVDNAEVLVIGSGTGVFVRSTAGGTLTATPTAFPGGTVVDIALDPENWQHFFVCDSSRVYETADAGNTWTELTLNRPTGNTALQSMEFVPTANGGVVLVGGNLGVSRLPLTGPNTPWTRFGIGLPNALVRDLEYNAADDILLAGTFGRGAWSVTSASTKVGLQGVLQIDGDTDFAGQDDLIKLVRNAANPLMLDVFLNSLNPILSVPLATLNQINVNGLGGNDTLILDSINGLISVAGGTRYAGGSGFDSLRLEQNGGPTRTTDTYSVGPATGSGSSVITDNTGTQTVSFQELEPVVDLVPAADLIVNATPEHNAISYTSGGALTNGKVLIDNYESIEFSGKTRLTIDASFGNDVVNLNNASTPTGLAEVIVLAGDGSDVVTTDSPLGVPVEMHGGAGNDLLDASGAPDGADLSGGDGNDTLVGSAGSDTLNGDAGEDLLNPGGGFNTVSGGAGADTLLVNGTNGADTIDIEHSVANTLAVTVNAVAGSNNIATLEHVRVLAAAGSDEISIEPFSAGGLSYTVLGGDPIGAVGDRLNIATGGAAATFTPGPENDSGAVVVDTTPATNISFDEIEALSISGGPAVVNGTNAPDAITVIARDASTHAGADGVQDFTVSVNDSPAFLFLNTANLTVNALAGSDEIVVRAPAPNNAVWDVDVEIDGGPPSASDKLIVETPSAGPETVNYAPTGSDSATLTLITLSSIVDVAGIEHLVYDGEGDNDTINVAGTAGDDVITHTPGAGNDEGQFRVNTTLALAYQNLGGAAVLNVNASAGSDEFVYLGTILGDTFTVNAAGAVALNSRLLVSVANANVLTLEGGGGDDKFTLVPAISASPYDVMNFTGAESSAGDTANLAGTAGADAFVVSGQSVTLGGKTVNMQGVEKEFLAAGGGVDSLHYQSVAGYSEEITVNASPVAGTGAIVVPWLMSLTFTGGELVDVGGDVADNDTLIVNGTNDVDNVQIQADAVGTAAAPVLRLQNAALATLLTLTNYTGIQTLRVQTGDGADVINVFTGPAIGRELFIDAGIPTAKKKLTDKLNIFYVFPRPAIVHSAATQLHRTGLVDLNYGTSRTLIQYQDVEDFIIRRV